MKRLIRGVIIDTFALFAASQAAQGMVFANGIQTLFLAGFGLAVAMLLAKPIINVLLLPLNLVTFGLFSWVSSAVVLYLVTLLVSGFEVNFFDFPGYTSVWFDLPALYFTGVLAYVAFAFIISLITTFVHWLLK